MQLKLRQREPVARGAERYMQDTEMNVPRLRREDFRQASSFDFHQLDCQRYDQNLARVFTLRHQRKEERKEAALPEIGPRIQRVILQAVREMKESILYRKRASVALEPTKKVTKLLAVSDINFKKVEDKLLRLKRLRHHEFLRQDDSRKTVKMQLQESAFF